MNESSPLSIAWDAYDNARDAAWDRYTAMGKPSLVARDLARDECRDLYEVFLAERRKCIQERHLSDHH